MSDERDQHDERAELAVRAVLARRRPTTLPDGLAERLDSIPDEVKPFPAAPVRLVVAVLPWAAVAVAGLVLALGPRLIARSVSIGTAPDTTWDPASPGGGLASVGWFGLPWVPALPFIALLGAVWAIRRVRSGRSLVPRPRIGRYVPRLPTTKAERLTRIACFVLGLGIFVALPRDWDPLAYDFAAGPGPGFAEILEDGHVIEEGRQPFETQTGQHVIYRLSPGQGFNYMVTVQNVGPVPVTIFGVPGDGATPGASSLAGRSFVTTGLGLLRDPNIIRSEPGDVVPFHPVELAPGEAIPIVVASMAGACADPTAVVPAGNVGTGPAMSSAAGLTWTPLVFDVFGWRRIGYVWPPFEITVATTPGCVLDEPTPPLP